MISINFQKKLSWIPLINATVLFIWLYNYRRIVESPPTFAKSLLVLFSSTLPAVLLQVGLLKIFATSSVAAAVINVLAIYLIPFAMARGLIWFQERVIKGQ